MNKMMNKISDKLYSARGETSSSEHFIEKREEQKVLVKGKKIILPFLFIQLYISHDPIYKLFCVANNENGQLVGNKK